ncbi:hypothetical protein [Butyrivibrio sp. VCD2006]|uniref:hypothetical protein n=1 Tax=Butyrivibrio sp. VCD2006 TaxID=1280664 RepID=UPI000427C5B9|nr:hypothetical protein [Butyrivibrio sp. VCD2006]
MASFEKIIDPEIRSKLDMVMKAQEESVFAELTEQDMEALSGAGWYGNLEHFFGHRDLRYISCTRDCNAHCN